MDELNLVPLYRNGMDEITPGIDVPVPDFCKKRCSENKKCKEYYLTLEKASKGMYVCPFGFNSYVFDIEGDNFIFTCLRVENHYDRQKLLPKIRDEGKEYRELSYANVEKYAQAYEEFFLSQNKYEKYKKFIDDIFHDVRKFNQQIKIKNERIYRKAQQHKRLGDILEVTKSIQQLGWFLTLRLNNHDFIYNEELMKADVKSAYNIYRIIDKVKKCIKERAEEKNIIIQLNASVECRDMQHISIRSIGPIVYRQERDKLTEQGFRSENAVNLTSDGMGIGLYTANCICELNDIKLKINSSPEIIKQVKNIDYSEFSVDFWIKLW